MLYEFNVNKKFLISIKIIKKYPKYLIYPKENKGKKKKMEYRTGEEKENKKHKMIKFNPMYQ